MKRLRDDNYPPAKRSIAASRGESYGQTQNSGAGSGGPKLTTDDALHYLKQVKEMFYNQRDKYDQFLEVMKDFKAQRIDTEGVIARVKELFKGHNHLIFGFNTFLPKGYEITLDEDESPPKKVVEFEEAINFVNKIKKRFQNDDHVYKSFLEILNMYRREHKNIGEVYEEVSQLFEDHPDLLDEFTRFLPDNSAAAFAHHVQKGRSTLHRYDDRGAHIPPRHVLFDKQRGRRDKVGSSHVEHDLSVEKPDLDDDKATIKAHKEQRRREKDSRDRRNRDSDDRDLEHDNIRDFNSQRQSDKRKASQREGFPPVSYDDKSALKSMYNQEFNFCERVKEKLGSSDDYQAFLKCLHIYSTEIITRTELQGLVADLLGKYPDLMEGFNDFLERCENIDGFLAGVMSKKSLWNDGQLPRSIKADDKDKEAKRDIEGAKEKKEKYWKSIQDLDLSNCQRCTPSYRLLPDDYPIHTASQRSELGAQVLNDHWVSVTSGSEDYSFKHMRRNQYEESLFKCEDDRFELDMLLESVTSTAKRTEDLLNSINSNTINVNAPIHIEDHFTALNIRCIERLYGDHGLDVMDIIRKHPTLALPVILTRLKQKQEEWTKCRSDFNKVWAEVYAKNHYKSLDHRSFYFKQQDSKNLSTKSLVAEIKERKEIVEKGDSVISSVAASYKRPLAPHLELHYPDVSVHKDTLKLIKYSCEEVCSTKEQLNKVMSLWSTFLEPMLGVPRQSCDADNAEDVSKAHHRTEGNSAVDGMDADARRDSDATILDSKEVKILANGNEDVSNTAKYCQTDAENGISAAIALGFVESHTACKDDMSHAVRESDGVGAIERISQQSISAGALPHAGAVGSHGKTNVEDKSGAQMSDPGPSNISGDIHEPKPNFDVIRSKDADISEASTMRNGTLPQGPEIDRIQEESAGHLKSEKEEGELSPTGDLEDDSSVVCRDAGTLAPVCEPCQNGNLEDVILDNDVDGDDEDSENASEAGEDASGSESGDDECSREEHEEEDDVENDELDGKVDSESEADVHSNGGDGTGPPQSDRFFISVKPLRKHVSSATIDAEKKDSRIFYGNDDFYVMFMLHHTLYERILTAKTSSTSSEPKWKNPKDSNSSDPYASFIDAVFNLLDGSSDNAKFEDDCRAIIGNQAYVLFTLDKLIYKLVKQLQTVATDEIDSRLLQLFEYEKSRRPENFVDSVYHENACVVLHDENIYRMEFSSSPTRLSIQLMDNINEKSDMAAISMEPSFSSYLHNQFLSLVPSRKEPCQILRKRNKRKYADLDESSAISLAMEDVHLFNGLEYKMLCRSSKIFYVLDTEDLFFRPSKRRSNLGADKRAKLAQTRVERFNKLLLSVL